MRGSEEEIDLEERVEKSLQSQMAKFEKSVVEQLLGLPLIDITTLTGPEIQSQIRRWERQITQILNRLASVKVIQEVE